MAPLLTEEEALNLQQELFEFFTSSSFQVKVQDIHARAEAGLLKEPLAVVIKNLALQEQKKVIPKYGFEQSASGVKDMVEAYKPHMSHPKVNALNYKINAALYFPPQLITISEIPKVPSQLFGGYASANPVPLPGAENAPREIKMLVFKGADVGDVRQQLAKEQKVPLEKVVLAKKVGHGLTPLRDDEKPPKHMKVKGIEKLRRASFTRDRALALQKELLVGYTSPDVQERIKVVQANNAELRDFEYMKEIKPILREVQNKILPRHNFEASEKGVVDMIDSFAPHMGDQEIAENNNKVNQALGLKNKAVEPITRTINLQPFVHPDEPGFKEKKTLQVAKSSTVLQLREQLAKELRIGINNIKLVGKKGGQDKPFSTLLDTEKPTSEIKVQGVKTFVVEVLSKDAALAILHDLIKAFKSSAFMSKVKSSIEKLPVEADIPQRNETLRGLIFAMQVGVLPDYGFRGTQEGLQACMEAFRPFNKDDDVQREQAQVEKLIMAAYKVAREYEIPPKQNGDTGATSSYIPAAEVSKPEALAFYETVLEKLQAPDFGYKIRAAQLKSISRDGVDLGEAMTELVDDVQMNVLPRYGFLNSSEGLEEWNEALEPHLKDPEVAAILEKVNAVKVQGTRNQKKETHLTHERAVTLQQELLEGFSSDEFQEKLRQIRERTPDKMAQVKEFRQLALTVQSEVLPRYGFDGTDAGVKAMLIAFAPLLKDDLVKNLTLQINEVLGLPNPL
eukprot:gnl/MRDRNA2_/MRDRNA2_83649_c0_seq1.p1 gnl/MRDRNA2_/MRDRNA2_83649_c0~~gnl/MRDRNA2_/MRDRNA2_83649_c0_seq1.p1  ORF type:complete len:735 (+),score=179.12 gnl/MRDRNA2_/MRDRNA2_83649_c0_seq1:76-2280(+)